MPCSRCCVSVSILPPPFRQRLGDRGLADHLAHRALGGGFDRRLGVPDVEQIGLGVLDHPEDGEVDIDDVLVAGQHQRLFRHLAGNLAAARALGVAIADLGPVDAGHARRERLLDRGRQVIVETGLRRPVIGAKPQDDPDLVGQNAIEAARQPDDEMPSTTMAIPVPVRNPPGRTRRKRSWPRRKSSSKSGGCGPRPRGPGPPPPRLPPQGPPPRGPLPHGPPP